MKRIFYVIILPALLLVTCSLQPCKNDIVKFGICTDVHLSLMHDAGDRLRTFVDAMNAEKPDFIIELGDFVTPDKKYNSYLDIWNSFAGEGYHVIGNHETDGGFTLQQVLEMHKMTNSYYSFKNKGFHFIVLDGNDKKSPDAKPYFRFIGPEQTKWLRADLSETKHPVIIFSHQELFNPEPDENWGIENYREIQEILEEHNRINSSNRVVACFNGHTHFDYAEEINGIWYITITSMSYHWLGDQYLNVRYSENIDRNFPWIKYTAPFKEPLFALVEISGNGHIRITGRKSEWVGPSPWDLGYPDKYRKYMRPEITDRYLKFSP